MHGVSPGTPTSARSARRWWSTKVEWYSSYQPLSLRDQLDVGEGVAVVTVLALLLMLAGTTFIGHDWNSGSMSNQLLFESRRGRIWAAKALVVTLAAFVVAAVVSSAYWLLLWAVARSRDLPSGTGLLVDSLQFGLRGALFAAGAALAGFALTMLFRSTVATIGVLFALSVGAGVLIAVIGLSGSWQPGPNLEAIAKNGTTYWVEIPEHCYRQIEGGRRGGPGRTPSATDSRDLSLQPRAPPTTASCCSASSVLSALSFRRRDVP